MLATLLFAFVVIVVAGLLIVEPRTFFASFFALTSVAFVNLGFFIDHLSHPNSSGLGLSVTSLGLLAVVLGILLGNRLNARLPEPSRFSRPAWLAATSVRSPNWQLSAMAIVILVPTWLYFIGLGYVPLFDGIWAVLTSGLDGLGVLNDSRLSRDDFVNAGATRVPLQGLLEIFRNLGVPTLFAFALAQVRRGFNLWPRVILMVICVVSVLAAGQRWPLMNLLVAAIFVLAVDGFKAHRRGLVTVAGGAVVGGLLLSILQARSVRDFENAFDSVLAGALDLFQRIFTGQAEVAIASYSSAAPGLRWQLGATYLQSFSSYLPGKEASYPVTFYQIVTGDSRGFTAPPDLYTEAYINFSWAGVVVIGVLWGLLISTLERRLFRTYATWDIAMRAGMLTILVFSAMTSIVFTFSFVFVAAGCIVANLGVDYLRRRLSSLGPDEKQMDLVEKGHVDGVVSEG